MEDILEIIKMTLAKYIQDPSKYTIGSIEESRPIFRNFKDAQRISLTHFAESLQTEILSRKEKERPPCLILALPIETRPSNNYGLVLRDATEGEYFFLYDDPHSNSPKLNYDGCQHPVVVNADEIVFPADEEE